MKENIVGAAQRRSAYLTFREEFLNYRGSIRVMKELDRLVLNGCDGREVGRPARCLIITGPSGSGKSRTVDEWSSKYPYQAETNRDLKPVLSIEVSETSTPKQLAETILLRLSLPEKIARSGSQAALTERVKYHLREQGVKVLILDEFQSLLKSSNPRVISNVGDFVKGLLNAGICPIVLVGMPEVKFVLEVNEQLERRSNAHLHLSPFDWEDRTDRAEFRGLLYKLGECFQVRNAAELGENQDLAFRIYIAAQGLLGRAADFLRNAVEMATLEGEEVLTKERLFATAHACRKSEDTGWVNPFSEFDVHPSAAMFLDEKLGRKTRLTRRDRPPKQSDLLRD